MNSSIQEHILRKIEALKTGVEYDILLANEMEKNIQEIQCFYCLDTKEIWGYRSAYHVFWSRFANNHCPFWVGKCNRCGDNQFLYDTNDKEIMKEGGYKLFEIDDVSAKPRVDEVVRLAKKNIADVSIVQKIVDEILKTKNRVQGDFLNVNAIQNTPEITTPTSPPISSSTHVLQSELDEIPDYEAESNMFSQSISKQSFSADIKKIAQILGGVLQAHVGIPNIDLLSKIELSMNFESLHQRKEQVFYKSSDKNDYFIFVVIKHVIKDKHGKILAIFTGDSCSSSIDCYYWIYKTKNQAAINILKQKMNEGVENELRSMSNILSQHYEKKENRP